MLIYKCVHRFLVGGGRGGGGGGGLGNLELEPIKFFLEIMHHITINF